LKLQEHFKIEVSNKIFEGRSTKIFEAELANRWSLEQAEL
jgi:hypothetical protein